VNSKNATMQGWTGLSVVGAVGQLEQTWAAQRGIALGEGEVVVDGIGTPSGDQPGR
jgi:hypothetical protein